MIQNSKPDNPANQNPKGTSTASTKEKILEDFDEERKGDRKHPENKSSGDAKSKEAENGPIDLPREDSKNERVPAKDHWQPKKDEGIRQEDRKGRKIQKYKKCDLRKGRSPRRHQYCEYTVPNSFTVQHQGTPRREEIPHAAMPKKAEKWKSHKRCSQGKFSHKWQKFKNGVANTPKLKYRPEHADSNQKGSKFKKNKKLKFGV